MKLGEIQRIAVLGSGTMGPGIAQSYAMGGYEVLLYDISKPALDKARGMLLANLDTYVQEDLLPVEEAVYTDGLPLLISSAKHWMGCSLSRKRWRRIQASSAQYLSRWMPWCRRKLSWFPTLHP